MDEFEESMGVNDRIALAKATKVMQRRINELHMKNQEGHIDDPDDPATTYIEADVKIGSRYCDRAWCQFEGQDGHRRRLCDRGRILNYAIQFFRRWDQSKSFFP